MSGRAWLALAVVMAALVGCATPPAQPEEDEEPTVVTPPVVPMIEYPPIEPVEPPLAGPRACAIGAAASAATAGGSDPGARAHAVDAARRHGGSPRPACRSATLWHAVRR